MQRYEGVYKRTKPLKDRTSKAYQDLQPIEQRLRQKCRRVSLERGTDSPEYLAVLKEWRKTNALLKEFASSLKEISDILRKIQAVMAAANKSIDQGAAGLRVSFSLPLAQAADLI